MGNIYFELPKKVVQILAALNGGGYEAYLVGGCVRDCILGRTPGDWDITTSAAPREVKALFKKTVDTGLKHGTVTVFLEDEAFEVTTYRVDGEYTDSRHPDTVSFSDSLKEDLSRRDFTVNAMAYHPGTGIIDPFSGLADIKGRCIRAVGDAGRRFREDALRMLRAVRFCSQLGFDTDQRLLSAARDNSRLILNISSERIRDELNKLLISNNPFKFVLLRETGLLRFILPELEACFETPQNNPYHCYDVGMHTVHALCGVPNESHLRWTMLFHDIGKPPSKSTDENGVDHFYGHPQRSMLMAEAIMKRLRFDNRTAAKILRLVKAHDRNIEPSCKAVRKAAAAVGQDIFTDLLKVQEADKRAQNPAFLKERLERLEQVRAIYQGIIQKRECLQVKDLAVDGKDLIQAGFKQGRLIGILLDKLLEAVLEDPGLNTGEQLLKLAKEFSVR